MRIVLDDNFALPPLKGATKQNTTTWEEPIPPIELSPYQPNYKIEFGLYREGALIGTGATSFAFTETRKGTHHLRKTASTSWTANQD